MLLFLFAGTFYFARTLPLMATRTWTFCERYVQTITTATPTTATAVIAVVVAAAAAAATTTTTTTTINCDS
jgi:hypothetical protein